MDALAIVCLGADVPCCGDGCDFAAMGCWSGEASLVKVVTEKKAQGKLTLSLTISYTVFLTLHNFAASLLLSDILNLRSFSYLSIVVTKSKL